MSSSRRPLVAVAASLVFAGCLPQPKVKDDSQLINGGVNVVPAAVLAAEKQRPSTAPIATGGIDLVETVLESDQKHYHLTEVLNASGLVPVLQKQGPFTLFAPTDAAFDKMPPGLLEALLKPANHDKLVLFLRYHLLRGRIEFADLLATNGQVQTMAGEPVTPAVRASSVARPTGTAVIIKGIDGKVVVNDVNVLRTDTAANNGIIHWVDGVLIPPPSLDSRTGGDLNE